MVFEHAKEEGNCQNVCVAIFTGTKSRLKIPEVGHLEWRGFLGLNPFCRIKYYKGQLLEVVLPCMTQLFIPCHKYFLGHMVNTLAVK